MTPVHFGFQILYYTIMSLQQIDFSKVLNDEQVYDHMMANYDQLGKDWINHQWRWMNAVYQAFKDHYKYMIIIEVYQCREHFSNTNSCI